MVAISSTHTPAKGAASPARRNLGQGRYLVTDVLHASGDRTLLVGRPEGLTQPVLIERITGLSKAALADALRRTDTLMALAHPNLARAVECFVADAALHVVMVAGPGALLSDPRGLVDGREAVDIGTQMCNAVGYLTWRGLPQPPRIDPATVYLTTAGRVKLTNLAALLGVRAPRRVVRAPAHQQAPIFGIGATLHHALTGWPPRVVADAPALATLRPDLSAACCQAIARALSATDTWASPAELRYALLQIPG